jgi:hypothetical protein
MDWASVVSIAITGLVGIAGVTGTIVSAKIASRSATKDLQLSIGAENDRQHKAEKRRVYAACLAPFTEMTWAALNFRLYHSKDIEPTSSEAEAEYERLRNEMRAYVAQANLIAPPRIRNLLDQCVTAFAVFTMATYEGASHADAEGPVMELGALRGSLNAAMRADLGETS